MSEWQPIETWDGEDGDEALLYDGFLISLAMFDKPYGQWWVLNEVTVEPTHWMSLPEPPPIQPKQVG